MGITDGLRQTKSLQCVLFLCAKWPKDCLWALLMGCVKQSHFSVYYFCVQNGLKIVCVQDGRSTRLLYARPYVMRTCVVTCLNILIVNEFIFTTLLRPLLIGIRVRSLCLIMHLPSQATIISAPARAARTDSDPVPAPTSITKT